MKHANSRARARSDGVERRDEVQSLSRALAILDALSQSHDGLTLTALAGSVHLPASTTHRLLTTLQRQRFVRFDSAATAWQIGVQAFAVGNAFARNRDVVSMARPYMRRLMEKSGETVNLYVLTDGEVICMAQVESRQMMRAIARPGGRTKMHSSGVGKAILAHLPEPEVKEIVDAHGLRRSTANTIGSFRALRADLKLARTRGFAIDDEEHAVGLRCVAAPVFNEHGFPFAGLSISGPKARISDERLHMLGSQVAEAARATAIELGGLAPSG